jgi:hypothetical protein
MEKKTIWMEIGRNKKMREKMVSGKGEASERRDKKNEGGRGR